MSISLERQSKPTPMLFFDFGNIKENNRGRSRNFAAEEEALIYSVRQDRVKYRKIHKDSGQWSVLILLRRKWSDSESQQLTVSQSPDPDPLLPQCTARPRFPAFLEVRFVLGIEL